MSNIIQKQLKKEMKNSIYIKLADLFKEMRDSYANTFYQIMNPGEEPLTNNEKLLLSNPEDRKKYLEALEILKKAREKGDVHKEVTIDLSNGEKITLITAS